MSPLTLQRRHADYYAIMQGGRRVAILTPARPAQEWPPAPAEPWSVIPDPAAFPDADCTGLPRPLSPTGNRFDTFEAAADYLGIPADAREALAA